MQLISARNAQLQSIRKAAHSGRETEDGLVVIEGPHLLEEALHSSWNITKVFLTAGALERYATLLSRVHADLVEVADAAFTSISATESSQQILALVEPNRWSLDEVLSGQSLILVLDGIQDPGNVGTMIRSAEAFGAGAAVLLTGTARSSNGKLLRAAAGSLFRLPYTEGVTRPELQRCAAAHQLHLYALTTGAARRIDSVDLTRPCALIVGREGAGISREVLDGSEHVSIATSNVESLNAAVAGSIALFEAHRQRSKP